MSNKPKSHSSTDYDYAPLLHKGGLKVTPIRIAILSLLAKSPTPLSIVRIASNIDIDADQATLYRNASLLKDAGIINEVRFEHDHAHYEFSGNHHHHIVCTSCGTTSDISSCVTDSMKKRVLAESNFDSIKRHSLEFFGLCANCAKEHKKTISPETR
jgi:Fe2+ or Zn2+ uptake regulation protein